MATASPPIMAMKAVQRSPASGSSAQPIESAVQSHQTPRMPAGRGTPAGRASRPSISR